MIGSARALTRVPRRARLVAGLTASLVAAAPAGAWAAEQSASGHGAARAAATGGGAAGPGQTSAAISVPWARVGPGWVLAEYSATPAGNPGKRGASSLYLISQRGRRYQVRRWPASAAPPFLLGWSGDKTRALLELSSGKLEQLNLRTGRVSVFSLPGAAQLIGYSRPDGTAIVAGTPAGQREKIARYSLHGVLQRRLADVRGQSMTALESADGTELVIGGDSGLVLVSNGGRLVRSLPVRRSVGGCIASRYWGSGSVLASCGTRGGGGRLWAVPLSGKAPVALTPARGTKGPDLGDIGAWKLGGSLYLQATGPCGVEFIARQRRNGSVVAVNVPGAPGNDNHIISARGASLLVLAATSCTGSDSLLWFDPRTRAERWLLRAVRGQQGVVGAVAYYSRQNQQY